jgi:hypothetical protein
MHRIPASQNDADVADRAGVPDEAPEFLYLRSSRDPLLAIGPRVGRELDANCRRFPGRG